MWARVFLTSVRIQGGRKLSTGFNAFQRVTQLTVDPLCKVRVETACPLVVRPLDLLDCPDSNLVRVTLSQSQDDEVKFTDSREGEQQVIHIKDNFGGQEVLLEVPVQADLFIVNTASVAVSNFQSTAIDVQSGENIKATNIKAEEVTLSSGGGEIECSGTILAQKFNVRTEGNGAIHLDKVLGDYAAVKSDKGEISIKSCYSRSSKFETNSGALKLNNVHRSCAVAVNESSTVHMSGFNGTLLMTINGGSVDLQLSELEGESVIVAHNPTDFEIKLSGAVACSTYVHASVKPGKLKLDDELEPARGFKENGATTINLSILPTKLFLQTEGAVRIKQLDWAQRVFDI